MSVQTLRVGFIPLTDAAPLIVAQELGFAAEEGLCLDLLRAPSWSALRDMLVFGQAEAAHMLSPLPVAMALGLGGARLPLAVVSVLSVNGNVIGVSRDLADRLRGDGFGFGFDDAHAAGCALIRAWPERLRVGVPFPFSMHAQLLDYWLSSLGVSLPQGMEIRTVPPRLMADAIAAGEIDAFCVGEPWGSMAVEGSVGELVLPGNAIWAFAPEKVLAVREDWAAQNRGVLGRLVRAVWRAGRWLAQDGSRTTAAELLARPAYVGVPSEILDRGLGGRLVVSGRGEERHVPGFIEFHGGAATFPWKSQAAWIGQRLALRHGLDPAAARASAAAVFRTDLYREHLAEAGAVMPGASEKLEGSLSHDTPAAATGGGLFLRRDAFFDCRIFDPSAAE